MKNTGKKYEVFVANLQKALIHSEKISEQKNIKIELNKKITDNCGLEREFDIYWEYEFAGITYKTVIECKDYNSKISVEKIDSLIGKIRDIPDLKPIFATKMGYQSGAKSKASSNKIELLIVREQNETDWVDENGNPYIKIINIDMTYLLPARITNFIPIIDEDWTMKNTDVDISKKLNLTDSTDKIIIEDLVENKKYSIFDMENELTKDSKGKKGNFEKEKEFKNAFIYCGNQNFKLNSYKFEYTIDGKIEQPIKIDFSKELIGVIEYFQKGVKKSIYKKGIRSNKITKK
ncbi:MAG: restriction endonuclease [Desulfobacterales bacterium]|nr:restriction endonuclease [Desulfobacterales bacterium]